VTLVLIFSILSNRMTEMIEVFPWNDNFETGISQIDRQHKVIVNLINQLASHLANQDDINTLDKVFTELVDYANYHFKCEESIWVQYLSEDPYFIEHKKTHKQFTLSTLKLKNLQGSKLAHEVIEDVLSFLTHWLADHILDSDMRMSKIVLALKSGTPLDIAKQNVEVEMSGVMKIMLDTTLSMYDNLCKRTLDLHREIKQRKKIEEELKLASSVFDNTLEGICITDTHSIIIDANTAFFESTGYDKQEVIAQHIGEIKSGLNESKLTAKIWQELDDLNHWSGEIQSRNKGGELQAEWLSLSTIKNDSDEIVHYIGIFSNISTLIKSQLELQQLAHHDTLTQLPNRLLLADRLDQAIANAKRNEQQFAVCFLDLDGFKPVNDNYGHATGDLVLCEISQRLKYLIRGNDTVARMGGDEFVILFNDIKSSEDCKSLITKLLSSISRPIEIENISHQVTASIGVATYPEDSENSETLLNLSDKAMFEAKRQGKSRYIIFQNSLSS